MPKKVFQKALAVMVTVFASAGVAMAQTVTPPPPPPAFNFTAVTAAVDASTIVTALTAIAAVKILPGVAKWGFNKVIGWFR